MSLLSENPAFYAIRHYANEDYRHADRAKLSPQEWATHLIEVAHEINVHYQYGLDEAAIERTVTKIVRRLVTHPTAAAGQLRDQKREEYAQLQMLGFAQPLSIARGIGDNAVQRWLCEREVGPFRPAALEPVTKKPVTKLPFGKYRFQTFDAVAKVDPGYLEWLVQKFEPGSELVEAAMEALDAQAEQLEPAAAPVKPMPAHPPRPAAIHYIHRANGALH